jgi:hypothetical protein
LLEGGNPALGPHVQACQAAERGSTRASQGNYILADTGRTGDAMSVDANDKNLKTGNDTMAGFPPIPLETT